MPMVKTCSCGSQSKGSLPGVASICAYNFSMFLHGIFPPITTPFYPDGHIYHRKLEQNVEHYSRTPMSGIVVLGSTGEAILLSDTERREALKSARDAAANEKVLIAGTG